MSPRVWVLLLNWNGWEDTLRCLASLEKQDYPDLKILLIDNGSTDESRERLRATGHPLLALPANQGFAGGMNRGAEYAMKEGADFLLLLNNDTELVPDAISRLVDGMEAGVVAMVPTILGYDSSIEYAGGWVRWGTIVHGKKLPPGPQDVSFATGCCLLVLGTAYQQLGGLSEHYFLYFEDADFCWRLREVGGRILYIPEARIWHLGGKSTGSQRRKAPVLDYYDIRNGLFFIQDHLRRMERLSAYCFLVLVRLPRKLFRVMLAPHRREALRAIRQGFADARRGKGGPYEPNPRS